MPAEDNNFDLYDVDNSTPLIRGLSEETNKEEVSDNDPYMESSAFGLDTSRIDNMLEVLPDDLGLHVTPFGGGTDSAHTRNAMEDLIPSSRPIDIASCPLTDEIAPMWDFKVEDFMMTPTPVDFNSSGPNSFNSNRYLHHSESAPSGQRASFINCLSGGLGFNYGMEHLNSSQSTSSSPKTETSSKNNNNNSAHAPSIGYRRTSNHFSKTVHTEDGGIALSSSATMNSVRKNQLTRQVSSTSLSNYKRGSSSGISDLPKKPPIQCYNCKTNKTPLWRRDPQGNTMCNACGLFQKLHGTMRPLSLKSDVIKKRNTKKRSEREKQAQESGSQYNNNNGKNFRQAIRKSIKKSIYENGDAGNNIGGGLPLLPQALPVTEANVDFGVTAHRMTSQRSQSQNERQQQYTSTENLNPNSLMDHNKKMASSNSQHSRKSRRSSTSSNNSSSSKSSSRSMVPILPKPSPGPLQFNLSYNGSSNSAGNSTGSSPRVFPTGCNPDSPMNSWQQNTFSGSPGKMGVSVPRRKSSRNHTSSSSFMAASLYQLQQHHQKQERQQQLSSNIQVSDGNLSGWNSGSQVSIGYSTSPATRSPKGAIDCTASPEDSSASRNVSRKPHTSLLSQQLQNSTWHGEEVTSRRQEQLESYTAGPRSTGTSQAVFLRSISAAASPSNGYEDSLLQRRSIREDPGSNFRRQNSIWARKNGCVKEQAVSSNNEVSTLGNTVTLTASPTLSAIASPAAAAASGESSSDGHKNIAEEFGWLKFNM